MFIGRYYHTLEQHNRVSLPKPFRSHCKSWVVTRGLDGGLFLFPAETFADQLEHIRVQPWTKRRHRDLARLFANSAQQVEVDTNGRVLLPEYLTKLAKLRKQVVIVGSYNYVELWDQELYHQYLDQLEPQAESVAEQLGAEQLSAK